MLGDVLRTSRLDSGEEERVLCFAILRKTKSKFDVWNRETYEIQFYYSSPYKVLIVK